MNGGKFPFSRWSHARIYQAIACFIFCTADKSFSIALQPFQQLFIKVLHLHSGLKICNAVVVFVAYS